MAQVSSSIAWNISTWVTTALAQNIYYPPMPLFCVFNTILCQKRTCIAFVGFTTVCIMQPLASSPVHRAVFLPLPSIPQAFFKIFLILLTHYINIKSINPHWQAFHLFSLCITPQVFSYFLLFSPFCFLLICILLHIILLWICLTRPRPFVAKDKLSSGREEQ